MKWRAAGETLTIYLSGEIDHCAAEMLREGMDKLIRKNRPDELILDFSEVSFMDSSGIGMLIGRYKTVDSFGGKTCARNLSLPIERLFRMAGLHRIITITENERRIDA